MQRKLEAYNHVLDQEMATTMRDGGKRRQQQFLIHCTWNNRREYIHCGRLLTSGWVGLFLREVVISVCPSVGGDIIHGFSPRGNFLPQGGYNPPLSPTPGILIIDCQGDDSSRARLLLSCGSTSESGRREDRRSQ